jgi:hypothetical protein
METPPNWPCPEECHTWAKAQTLDSKDPQPLHHPRCKHYNDSLIDVWRISLTGEKGGCVVDKEADALDMTAEDPDLTVTKTKMHKEVFENLPEFQGF